MSTMLVIGITAGLTLAAILGAGCGWIRGYLKGYDDGRAEAEEKPAKEVIPPGGTMFDGCDPLGADRF